MAGGPLFPFSAKPDDTAGRLFPNWGGSGNDSEGMGVMASLSANAVWKLRFLMPTSLPTGTCKLCLDALANATSGSAKVNPKWASVAAADPPTEDPDAFTVTAEGTATYTWTTGYANEIYRQKIILDADTVVAGEWLVMDLTFENTGWTLAAVSTWVASIIWE